MKKDEKHAGWFLSHLGWFIVLAFVLMLLYLFMSSPMWVGKAHAQVQRNSIVVNQSQQLELKLAPAKLPKEFLVNSPFIRDMRVGDVGYEAHNSMLVDEDSSCYLLGNIELNFKKKDMGIGWIRIEKKVDGYSVFFRRGKVVWYTDKIHNKEFKLEKKYLVPVMAVVPESNIFK